MPYDPIVLLELARYDEEHGKADIALKAYAKLAVLPLFDEILHQVWKADKAKHASPRESAEKLWKSTARGQNGRVRQIPRRRLCGKSMPKFTGKPVDPRPADPDNRVVLCELFTGATAAIAWRRTSLSRICSRPMRRARWSPCNITNTSLSPIRLANQDSEARFRFYFPERGGNADVHHRRACPPSAGGLLHQAGEVYASVRSA